MLCCKACNAAKKDKAILAFLLGNRKRIIALYKYGRHLSHQLVEMVDDLLPEDQQPPLPTIPHAKRVRRKTAAEVFGVLDHGASPYLDDQPVAHAKHAARAAQAPAAAPRAHAAPAAPLASAPTPKRKRGRRGRGKRASG